MQQPTIGLFALLFGGALFAQDLTTPRGFHGFGGPSALAVDAAETRAYVGESAAVSVLDLSVLAVPMPPSAMLARIPVDAAVVGLTLDESNQRLLVAGGSYGLLSIDLASPTFPVSSHDDIGDHVCFKAALATNHVVAVFGAANASEVRVYDRSSLSLVGSAALGTGTAFSLALDGSFAYVAMGTGGLARVNLTNPAAPTVQAGPVFPVGVFGEPARTRDIAIGNGRICVAADGLGLVVTRTAVTWSPTMAYTSYALAGTAIGGAPAALYAHRVAIQGSQIHVGANSIAGREADGGPFTSFGPMSYNLSVGGVATPGPLAAAEALVVFQIGSGGITQIQQVDAETSWRELIVRPTRVYETRSFTGTFVRDAATPTTVLASYRGAAYQPAEAFLSLRDPNLALCGQDGAGPAYAGLLDISSPDAITPVPGTAGLGSFGLWFDAHWLDTQPTREWFVGNGEDFWQLRRFDTTQPGLNTFWNVPSPDDPLPGFNNGRNYWLSWLDGDLLLLTRAGTRWGFVGYSRSALEAEAATKPPGSTLTTPHLWQLETHFAPELDQAQNWRCRTFTVGSQRLAVIAAGFHTAPGPNESRPQVVIYDISAGTASPPTLVTTILGPNLQGNAMAVATREISGVTYLFVVDFGYGLHVYDVSTPASPTLVGGWAAPVNIFDGLVDHPTDIELVREPSGALSAYMTLWRSGLVQLDVTNPAMFGFPVLDQVDTPGLPYGIAIRDVDGSRGLVLADHQAGLRLYGHYAKWQSIGPGCAGAGAVPELSVVTAPVLGGTFELQVTNLGAGSVTMVTGFSPASVPLNPLDPSFATNCILQASPDIVDALAPVGGTANWTMAVPATPSLVGLHLWNQVVEQAAQSALSNAGEGVVD